MTAASSPRHRRADPRTSGLLEAARELQPATVALRRTLHRTPEVGLMLPKTQAAVLAALADLPIELHHGRALSSVVGVLRGSRDGPTVLLRADMDALPVAEESGVPFRSEVDGVMHACGHDAHVAMLASVARILAHRRSELAGTVLLAFQPGEEAYDGAKYMLAEGLLELAGTPERALALHITSTVDSGVVQCKPGPIMASSDTLRVVVHGRTGHASAPHNALDPVPAAAAMVGALQTAITRSVSVFDPVVLTISHITAGTTSNVVPDTATLVGTVRTLSDDTRRRMHGEIHRVCEHVAAAHGCQATITIEDGCPVTTNDTVVTRQVMKLARDVLGRRFAAPMSDPIMGAEDFSHVLERVPGTMAFLGACPPNADPASTPGNHSSKVTFDEAAMVHGVALYSAFALDALTAP